MTRNRKGNTRPPPRSQLYKRSDKRSRQTSRYSNRSLCYGPGSDKVNDETSTRERRGTEQEIKEVLHVTSVEYNIPVNTKSHRTDKFACTEGVNPTLVVRRGQPFLVNVTLDKEYDKNEHDLKLCFETGKNPKPPKGTAAEVDVEEDRNKQSDNPKEWFAVIVKNDKKNCELQVKITPPCHCVIGKWKFDVETSFSGKEPKFRYKCKSKIIIILNPWCPNDLVYYENTKELDEYIFVEHSCLYTGNYKQIEEKRWDHGQFQQNNLKTSLRLIKNYFKKDVKRMGNPVELTRAISAVVNSQYGGLLHGNWSGKYEGGTAPTKWKSSTTIFAEYEKTGNAVKYGQCWVFSALATTICRAIGIPCRSVTNFLSAHDTDGSCKIDKEYKLGKNGKKLPLRGHGDSIWNFHVWNEGYMCRPDVKGKRGWQAFDATPQELSDGDYKCGPAPINEIKKGEIRVPFDSPFIFAEVNSDVYHWLNLGNDQWRLTKVEKNKVGQCISTKYPDGKAFHEGSFFGLFGGTERLDLTDTYKYREGTDEERLAVKNAGKQSKGDIHEGEDITDDDVQITIDVKDGALFGESFDIKVSAQNISSNKVLTLVDVSVELASCSYNGVVEDQAFCTKELNGSIRLPQFKEEDFSFKIRDEDYEKHLKNPYAVAITVNATVKETGESITEEETNFRLRRPIVSIDADDKTKFGRGSEGEEFEVTFKVKTKFNKKLTNCKFSVIGTRIDDIIDSKIDSKYLTNDGCWEQTVKLKPLRRGEASIAVDFDCDQIEDVVGSTNIEIY